MSVDWERGLRPIDLGVKVGAFHERFLEAALVLGEDLAQLMQGYMQTNAPWTDRTGNARQGLTVVVNLVETAIVFTLFHTMDYGIWLEVANAGNYAIIMPTIEAHFATVLDELAALVKG